MIRFQDLRPGQCVRYKPQNILGIVTQQMLSNDGHSQIEIKYSDGDLVLYEESDTKQVQHMQNSLELVGNNVSFRQLTPGRFVRWKPDKCMGIVVSTKVDGSGKFAFAVRWSDSDSLAHYHEDNFVHDSKLENDFEILDESAV